MSWQSGESYEATVTGVGNSPVSDYSTGENQNQSFYPFTLVIHGDANLSNGESVNLSMNGIAAGSDGSIYLEKCLSARKETAIMSTSGAIMAD